MTEKLTFTQLVAVAKYEPSQPIDTCDVTMAVIRQLPRMRPATGFERFYDAVTRAVAGFILGDRLSDVGASNAGYAPLGASLEFFGLYGGL